MGNQFTNQLGYFQGNLAAAGFSHTISTIGTFEDITPELIDDPIFQYNTDLSIRGSIFIDKGVWRYDFVGTWNGATNDDMQLRLITQSGNVVLPPVKWNARGGNNWAISYSVMFKVQEIEVLQLQLMNEDDTATSVLLKGIFTCIKLY